MMPNMPGWPGADAEESANDEPLRLCLLCYDQGSTCAECSGQSAAAPPTANCSADSLMSRNQKKRNRKKAAAARKKEQQPQVERTLLPL